MKPAESLARGREALPSAESLLLRGVGLAMSFALVFMSFMFGQETGADDITLYYVATTGSDSNPGTLSRPFRTLQRGVNAAVPGDTIIVRDGTYTGGCFSNSSYPVTINKAGTSGAWITLKAENKWRATLDSQNVCHSFIKLGSTAAYWVIQDFRVINGWGGGIWNNLGAGYITLRGNEIAYIGRTYRDSTIGIVGSYANATSHHLTFDGNVFHHIGRTGGPQTDLDHGLYLQSKDTTIVNNVFYQPIVGWGIQTASGFSGLIANNTFHGPHATKEGHIMLWDASGSITVRNNIFYAPRRQAIAHFVFRPETCMVDHNIVYGPGVSLGAPISCSTSNNRLNTDPMFANATSAPYDFRLRRGSPAIDTGAAVTEAATDFDAVPRPQGSGHDVGAFEFCFGGRSVSGGNLPYFEPAWVVNSAFFGEGLSAGAFGTIFGFHLTSGETGSNARLSNVLAGTRVCLDGRSVSLSYASEQQINFVVPANTLPGTVELVCSTPVGDSSPVTVSIQAAGPGIFVLPGTGNAGAILRRGAEMEIYCTGLGAVNSDTGQTQLPVTVWLASRQLTPSFSGPHPDQPGLYLVRAEIPPDFAGEQTVSIAVNGIRSNEVKFFVE